MNISVHICAHARYRICICAHACAACSFSIRERGWGGPTSVSSEGTCSLTWGFIFDRRRDRGVVWVLSIFNAGGSVCGCRCVYTHWHTHTHTAHMRYSYVVLGVGMRHLEGPENPDGLNLGIFAFVYVYEVHIYMNMLGGGMRSWTDCFFSLKFISFGQRKAKDVNTNHR